MASILKVNSSSAEKEDAMAAAKKDKTSGKIRRLRIRSLASQQTREVTGEVTREVKGGALNAYISVSKGKKQGP